MPLLLVGVPAVAAVLGLLLGRSRRTVAAVAITGALGTVGLTIALLAQQPWQQPFISAGWSGPWSVMPFATIVDGLAACAMALVSGVALAVQIYSVRYLRDHVRYSTYAAFVSLFTAAMLAVVVAGDLLLLLVGWEVMGLCSYVLIGQYWERSDARAAAMKAFLVTKAADVGFLLGVLVLGLSAGSFLIPDAVAFAVSSDETRTSVATLLLLVGVLGKSAQFPLHAWLPDAMTGPSPVSALIHAATMVAAGVYVVIRLYPAFLESGPTMAVLPMLASISMVGAAVAALAQTDLKRILAWSTVSQLAVMLGALAVGGPSPAMFHLLTHGAFKALLFLAGGAVLLAAGTTDLARLGGLRRSMPVTAACFAIGAAALVGVPPLSGFFSKESVLDAALAAARGEQPVPSSSGWTVLVALVLTLALTAAYTTRLWLVAFTGSWRGTSAAPRDPSLTIRLSLVALAVPAAGLGLLGLRTAWLPTWSGASATSDAMATSLAPQAGSTVGSLLAIVVGGAGAVMARRRIAAPGVWSRAAHGGFGIDIWYDRLAIRPFRVMATVTGLTDTAVLARAVEATGSSASRLGLFVQRASRGDVQRALSIASTVLVFAAVVLAVTVAT